MYYNLFLANAFDYESPCTGYVAEEIKPGTLCQVYTYRTKDGQAYFQFYYKQVNNYWEIDIYHQPSYRNRDDSPNVSHRLPSSTPNYTKICVSQGKEPKSFSEAQELSKGWAELTWYYIKTGYTIDEQIMRNY